MSVEAAVDEVGQERGGHRVFSVASSHSPTGTLTPSVVIPSPATQQRPLSSIPSIMSTARRTSPRHRLISAARFSAVLALNSREIDDFEVERSAALASSPTGSEVRAKRRWSC